MTKKTKNNVSKYIAVLIVACLSFFCFSDSVEDCESLKSSMLSTLDSIQSTAWDSRVYASQDLLGNALINADFWRDQIRKPMNADNFATNIINGIISTTNDLQYIYDEGSLLRQLVVSIDCTSCVSDTNSCCCCDYLPSISSSVSNLNTNLRIELYTISNIVLKLDYISRILQGGTNILTRILDEFNYQGGYNDYAYYHAMYYDLLNLYPSENVSVIPDFPYSIVGDLTTIAFNLADSLPSINNYLYYYIYDEFSPYANHVTNNLITLTDSSTNFFSFFVSSTTSRPVLSDYNGLDFPSYHAYLTNFYINVAEGNTAHFTAIQRANTNWFGRIETLIASLVFASAETNPVDDKSSVYDDMAQEFQDNSTKYKDDLTGLVDSPVGTTRSAVSSLRSLSHAFSDASMPEEVNLVSIPLPDGTQDIKFYPSGSGASAFRCVSTVVWVFTALFLVVQFIWYSFRSISHIVIFIWDVLSMIFGGSK